ncbi:MAG: FHA domain-containing protein [Euryarchaeota archaeon]|nr:FHA domain-containing protein [Euryarchaeota archaeon]
MTREEVDYDGLAKSMQLLSDPQRLRVVRGLIEGKSAEETLAADPKSQFAGTTERLRKAREELATLKQGNFISTKQGDRVEANPQALYQLAQEIKRLATKGSSEVQDLGQTVMAPREFTPMGARGPRFILVSGLGEGKTFPLAVGKKLVLGRATTADVSLDYDPFVSSLNSIIEEEGGRFRIIDVPEARNGTSINFRRIPRGSSAVLENGDIIGVGRSLLVFRA